MARTGTKRRELLFASAMIAAVFIPTATVLSAPQNGTVVGGQASISQTGTATSIQQTTNKAIINWQGFSTGANESVQFTQPSAQSVILNRVTGTTGSTLNGRLSSNGTVFLINPNGVMVGPTGTVDVGSFLATTSGITDTDFLAGRYAFTGAPDNSQVANQGTIRTSNNGSVILSAPSVQNSGTISTPWGSTALGAAKSFTAELDGNGLLQYQIGDPTTAALVTNSGNIIADGGKVLIAARSADLVARQVINTAGLVEANSVAVKNGEIYFDGGSQGSVAVSGQVLAEGLKTGETGGTVTVTGDQVAARGLNLDASGQSGGGSISLGNWQASSVSVNAASHFSASAITNGDGGTISVIGGQAQVTGTLLAAGGSQSGNGGAVETSGHTLSVGGIWVNVGATEGRAGRWLLDPADDLTVDANLAGSINTALGSGSVTLQTSPASCTGVNGGLCPPANVNSATGNGDIIINSPISWASANMLTLDAYRNVAISTGASIAHGTNSTLQVVVGDQAGNGTGSAANGHLILGGNAGIGGTTFTVINTISDLTQIATNFSGNYALGSSLGGVGALTPLGNQAAPFTGTFDGLGNTISGATINGTNYVGLFGYNTGTIRNINLTGTTVIGASGGEYVGALAGENDGTISSSSSSGTVTGGYAVGGLVGLSNSSGTISNSSTSATVSGSSDVGGFIGVNNGVIIKSYATGNVSETLTYPIGGGNGGFVGENAGLIISSFATGSVSDTRNGNGGDLISVAGFAGENDASGRIESSYSTGDASRSLASVHVAGFAYSVGGTVTSCYWDTTTSSAQGDNSGTTGLIDSNMQLQLSYSGWDFINNWTMGTYPVLNTSSYQLYVIPTNTSKVYGAALPGFTNTVVGFKGSDTSAIVSTQPTLTTAATATSSVGTYTITGSGAAATSLDSTPYAITYVPGTLTITKASLTLGSITVADKTYDATISATIASYGNTLAPVLAGDISNVTISGSASFTDPNAGNGKSVNVTGLSLGGSAGSNYSLSSTSTTSTANISAKQLTVNGLTVPASKAYDGTNSAVVGGAPSLTASEAAGAGTTNDGKPYTGDVINFIGSATGSYNSANVASASSVTLGGLTSSNTNYTLSLGSIPATITPYQLTPGSISVAGKTYDGTTSASITGYGNTLTSVLAGDVGNVTVSGAAAFADPNAGSSKTVNVTGLSLGGSAASNYSLASSSTTAMADIGAAALTITANNASKAYGAANPTLSASYSGWVNGDDTSSLTTPPTLSTTATTASPVGNYPITPSGAVNPNYSITYVPGTLAVGQATLTITANNANRPYGSANPTLSAAYSGWVNGDDASSLTTPPTLSTTATGASPVGSYPITPSGAVNPNYAITYVPGTLAVGQAALTITANNAAKTYGAANPTLSASYSGWVNGDTSSSLTTAPTLSTTATNASPAGSYPITPSGAGSPNYAITYVPGTLAIGQAALTITANNAAKTYGAANPILSASYSGWVNGDAPSSLTTAPTLSTTATATSPAGSYPITPSGAADPNYSFTYVPGTLSVQGLPTATTSIVVAQVSSNTGTAPQPSTTTSVNPATNVATTTTIQTTTISGALPPLRQVVADTTAILNGNSTTPAVTTVSNVASTPGIFQTASDVVTVPTAEATTTTSGVATASTTDQQASDTRPSPEPMFTLAAAGPMPPASKEPPAKPAVVSVIPGILNMVVPTAANGTQANSGAIGRHSATGNKALW